MLRPKLFMGYVMMIVATLIWGAGFVGTRWTLIEYTATWSNALRFVISGLLVLPFLLFNFKGVRWGVTIFSALLMFLGLHFQTVGIAQTTLAKSGFLTVFYALFTPMIVVFVFKEKIRSMFWALVFVAVTGIALLCDLSLEKFNLGDASVLLSALIFACHIVWIDRKAQREDPIRFNFWQCFFVGVFGLSLGLATQEAPDLSPLFRWEELGKPSPLSGFLILSVFSSLLAFTIQISAQKKLRAHVVSLIFLLESVFATVFGYLFFQERLSPMGVVGAALVLISVALVPVFCRMDKESD